MNSEVTGNSRPSKSGAILSNGARLDFKVANDETGTPVVSQLLITFDSRQIPTGGIGGSLLREIKISELLATWFQESSRVFFSRTADSRLLDLGSSTQSRGGRTGLDGAFYAALSYFYIQYCESFPNSPTASLAGALGIGTKTLSTRLLQCRKLGFLSNDGSRARSGKAHGQLTASAKKVITRFLEGK